MTWLRVSEVAGALGVSANTVRRWTDAGRIASYRSPGGHRRYLEADVKALLPGAGGSDRPQPGDMAALRARAVELQSAVEAGLDLMQLLTEAPHDVPSKAARLLCRLTGAPRCDVYAREGTRVRVVAAVDGGEIDESDTAATWTLDEWLPVALNGAPAEPVALTSADPSLDGPATAALRRRGCHSLVWAPMFAHGDLVGAVEIRDAEPRDLSPHLGLAAACAAICAQALAMRETKDALGSRDRWMRELIELSHEIARTHDVEAFVQSLAERLMNAMNADCVDIWRVTDTDVHSLISLSREGPDERLTGTTMDLTQYPSLNEALARLEPLTVSSPRDPRLTPAEARQYATWGYASSLSMPLVAGGLVVGLVELYDDAERDWSVEVDALTGILQPVAGLFDNAVLVSELEAYAAAQHEVVQMAGLVQRAGSVDDIAFCAAEHLKRITGCDDCDIWSLEEGYLRCLVSLDDDGVDEEVHGKTLELGLFPSTAKAIEAREPCVCASLDDPRVTPFERDDWGAYGYNSALTVPLVSADQVVGMIDLYDKRERDYADVIDFVVRAAGALADALQNARLMTSLRHSNAALRELVELSDHMNEADDLGELARIVCSRLRAILKAEDCDIWGIEGGRMRCIASIDSRGWDAAEVGGERDLGAYVDTVAALAANEPLVVGDLDDADMPREEKEAYARWGYRSMVSLPLVAGGRPLGLIDVFDVRVRDYGERLDFIRNVGRLLAGAFEKAMLVDRLESGNRDLGTLVEAGLQFGGSLEVDSVFTSVTTRLLEVSGADMCDICELHGDEIEIVVSQGGSWDEDPVGMRFPLADYGIYVQAVREKRPVVKLDILNDAALTPMERSEAERWGYQASMDIPLMAHGEVSGFVTLYNRESRGFERTEVIVGIAQTAGLAIFNARLYRELNENVRRTSLMAESALEFTRTLDLDETLEATARRLCDSVHMPCCDIYVIDGDHARCVMSIDDSEVDHHWIGQQLEFEDSLGLSQLLEDHKPVVVSRDDPRLSARERELAADHDEATWATLPLIAGEQVIGTVDLLDHDPERLMSDEELETATTICHVAAVAIENARLFASERVANRETKLLNEIAQRTAASLDLEEIVEAAVTELRQLLPFERHSLMLISNDRIERVIASRDEAELLTGLSAADLRPHFLTAIQEEHVLLLRLPDEAPIPPDHPALAGLRSAAIISLPSDSGLLGLLSLSSTVPDAFEGVDLRLLERVGTQLSLAIKNARLYEEIKHMHLGNLKALSSALNAKDYYTLGHAARVSAYMVMLGRELGWSQEVLAPVQEAAYLHDIGKISISDRVLLKPGRLNQQEWQQMREHPVFSADIIRPLFPEPLVLAVRHHHERYDGGGYPDGLAGEAIPPMARAMAVVDAYDAMSCRRPYKPAFTYKECVAELLRCRGSQFEPEMVDAFLRVLQDLSGRREHAVAVATEAAALVSGEDHRKLRSRDDEDTAAYRRIARVLRRVRDANPPTRFLTTHTQIEKKFVIGVDPEEDATQHSHFGDEIFADDELPRVLAGEQADINTVFADEFGVWINALAPVVDADGQIVAAVSADLPALGAFESDAHRGDDRQSFAAMLQTAAVRLSRAEIDAITDALTGLYNHRYLHERLSEELHRMRDIGKQLSVLFCDIDHFKAYNDANGHSAGDHVLREVAHIIEQSVRNIDVAARYGGEEFVVVLVETAREQAAIVAERIRERIRAAGFSAAGEQLTVSIGVATFPDDADHREQLLEASDAAMYAAKAAGRDQVVLLSPALATLG